MKIIITAKNENLDESVDEVIKITDKIKGYEWKSFRCLKNGTTLILEK